MLAWVVFSLVCFLLGLSVVFGTMRLFVGKREDYPNEELFKESKNDFFYGFCSRKLHDMFGIRYSPARSHVTTAGFVAKITLMIFVSLPFLAPFFVEFPSLVLNPTVATIDEDGELVYHPLGLWTPPWKGPGELGIVNVYNEGWGLYEYNQNSDVLVEGEDWFHFIRFSAWWIIADHRKFYSDEKRRLWSNRPRLEMEMKILDKLFANHVQHKSDFEVGARVYCLAVLENSEEDRVWCPALSTRFEDLINPRFEKDGVIVMIRTSIEKFREKNEDAP